MSEAPDTMGDRAISSRGKKVERLLRLIEKQPGEGEDRYFGLITLVYSVRRGTFKSYLEALIAQERVLVEEDGTGPSRYWSRHAWEEEAGRRRSVQHEMEKRRLKSMNGKMEEFVETGGITKD